VALHFHHGFLRDAAVQHRVGNLLARQLAATNILGRAQILKRVHKKTGNLLQMVASSRVNFDDEPTDPADTGSLTAGFSTDLANDDISNYIGSLVPVSRDIFDGLTAQYRKDAFTLAGAADVRLIAKIRDALADVAQKGGTAQDFEAAVRTITDDAGIAELNSFTLDTAFNTAMQKAFSLGRYEQMSDPAVKAVLPYWQYWTVGDDRVRPEHAVLDGFTARAEDAVWMKIYPPNGFNCRCSVIPILAKEAGKDADEPGYSRLPLLARLKVPQAGFGKVFRIAA
jgi:SPP1 gp7 family putative phage head morphogenesis protein